MGPTRVIALGHPYGGDDAVGLAVLEALRGAGISAELHHASDTSALVLLCEGAGRVVIVDALVGGGAPGNVRVLTPEQLDPGPRSHSSHGLSLPQAIELARALATENPPEVMVVAIAIARPAPPAIDLSPDVARAVSDAVDVVLPLVR